MTEARPENQTVTDEQLEQGMSAWWKTFLDENNGFKELTLDEFRMQGKAFEPYHPCDHLVLNCGLTVQAISDVNGRVPRAILAAARQHDVPEQLAQVVVEICDPAGWALNKERESREIWEQHVERFRRGNIEDDPAAKRRAKQVAELLAAFTRK